MPNIMAFKTPDESGFLVFGVSNAKYLAFDKPDENALRCISVFEELFLLFIWFLPIILLSSLKLNYFP